MNEGLKNNLKITNIIWGVLLGIGALCQNLLNIQYIFYYLLLVI